MSIGVVDYNAGNLKSVELALAHINAEFFISSDPDKLQTAEKILFPGVGEASWAMKNLRDMGLVEVLKSSVGEGKPFLGICLGSQILLEYSEEGDTSCLGLLKGQCREFSRTMGLKVPHMGWNTLVDSRGTLFRGVNPEAGFYFVHSYYMDPADPQVIAAGCDYGGIFTCAMEYDNLFALQFHPEKSGKPGLQILENFDRL